MTLVVLRINDLPIFFCPLPSIHVEFTTKHHFIRIIKLKAVVSMFNLILL